MVIVLFPTARPTLFPAPEATLLPFTVIVALAWVVAGVTMMDVVPEETLALYAVMVPENPSARLPGVTARPESEESLDFRVTATV